MRVRQTWRGHGLCHCQRATAGVVGGGGGSGRAHALTAIIGGGGSASAGAGAAIGCIRSKGGGGGWLRVFVKVELAWHKASART